MFKITDILDRCHVIPGIEARDKATVLRELASRASVALKRDEGEIAAALEQRERLGSTGVGHGIAIPHARLPGLTKPFGMFARIEPPVDFNAIDNAPVDLVFLLLTPTEGSAHLSALAGISRRLRTAATAAAIRNAGNAREIFDALTVTS